jgi:hypothetical protein
MILVCSHVFSKMFPISPHFIPSRLPKILPPNIYIYSQTKGKGSIVPYYGSAPSVCVIL